MNENHMQMLYLELSRMEDRGITLWMEGYPSNPQDVASQMRVNEENSYMRDYVFNEGVLTEVHFDKINNTNTM